MKHIVICCMHRFFLLCMFSVSVFLNGCKTSTGNQVISFEKTDSLPSVFPQNHGDIIEAGLRMEAILRFTAISLPDNKEEWKAYSEQLRKTIIDKAGVIVNHDLPLDIRETGSVKMKGYTVRNISFQTKPGIYATANLYVPDGPGPFPGVINMLGHWRKGKIETTGPQAVGHTLAVNGYVCLSIDPWGAGERTTKHGDFEYHGANLGASLMNIGEPLIGIQISDNMRGVDLLCSLPQVDSLNIGATGASGGGNQSMWLAAVDRRVKAVVPVVSVGTFESYVMRSNCICELLIDGLTFTEEAGVLALTRAVMPCNHLQDIVTFHPSQTSRTVNNALPVFKMLGIEKNISSREFDLTHGYWPEDREAMLGWFDMHLKGIGTGNPMKEKPFEQVDEQKLMVFSTGERDKNVMSTDEYCRIRGNELRTAYLNTSSFNAEIKRKELKAILRLNEKPAIKKIHLYSDEKGWNRYGIETSDNKLIPVLHFLPSGQSKSYVILCNPEGKAKIDLTVIDELKQKGMGIVIADLTGTGEVISSSSKDYDQTGRLHTVSRAELWLGKTILGEWVKELNVITGFLKSEYRAEKISIYGYREAGLAGLFLGATEGNVENITLRDAPVSYLFDNRESVDYFSMGIHLPGFLKWGDVSLAAALIGKDVSFINPVTMSGTPVMASSLDSYKNEYQRIAKICNSRGNTLFD